MGDEKTSSSPEAETEDISGEGSVLSKEKAMSSSNGCLIPFLRRYLSAIVFVTSFMILDNWYSKPAAGAIAVLIAGSLSDLIFKEEGGIRRKLEWAGFYLMIALAIYVLGRYVFRWA